MEINHEDYLLVDFEKYCKTCKHKDKKEKEEPCANCLEHSTNLHSHKPIKWEKK